MRKPVSEVNSVTEVAPPGVVVLYVHEGRVVCHAADFHQSAPGGFSLREAQTMRAKRSLSIDLVRALSSPLLADSMDEFDCERAMRRMKGETLVIAIGDHGND